MTKAKIFTNFFAEQCTQLKNDSVLRTRTQSRLHSLDFNLDEIVKTIRPLNVNIAQCS